jgi:hypothetical protein
MRETGSALKRVGGRNRLRAHVPVIRIAAASPTPNCIRKRICSVLKIANTNTMTMAALERWLRQRRSRDRLT